MKIINECVIKMVDDESDKSLNSFDDSNYVHKRIDFDFYDYEKLERLNCIQSKSNSINTLTSEYENLFCNLEVRVLPISSEVLTCYSNFTNLNDLYENLVFQNKSPYLSSVSISAILGFDAFMKSLNKRKNKKETSLKDFLHQHEESKFLIDDLYFDIIDYLLEYFKNTNNSEDCFIPLKSIKCGGTMNDIISISTLRKLLANNEERIKEILSYYYVPKTDHINSVKGLIYTPNQRKNAIKKFK